MRRARAAQVARAVTAVVAAVVGAAGGATGHGPAAAQEEPFAPLETVARPPAGPVLFFPLADEFESCLPLTGPCPEGSSALVLVGARGRRVAWSPEGGELPTADGGGPAVPAVGSPPPQPERARYLVPLIDGGTPSLRFAPRRLDGARLVPFEGEAEGTAVVPALAGPMLPAGTPQGLASERLLEAPRVVDAAELADAVPVLLVRRASPSRVAFGVLPDPAWGLAGSGMVPLVGTDSVAVLARHDGEVGVATAAPEGVDVPGGGSDGEGPGGSGDGGGRGDGDDDGGAAVVPVAAAGAAVVAAGALGVMAVRRRRRRAAAGPGRPVI